MGGKYLTVDCVIALHGARDFRHYFRSISIIRRELLPNSVCFCTSIWTAKFPAWPFRPLYGTPIGSIGPVAGRRPGNTFLPFLRDGPIASAVFSSLLAETYQLLLLSITINQSAWKQDEAQWPNWYANC